MKLTPQNIGTYRVAAQQIAQSERKTAGELVRWMGAIQAQDFEMAKFAIGVRLDRSTRPTDAAITEAYLRGELLRTHVLRPTWHFIMPDDIRWMLELTAPQIKKSMQSRHKQLGIMADTVRNSRKIIETFVSKNKSATREELVNALKAAKIRSEDPQFYVHLFLHAELDCVICSGPMRGRDHTYAFLDDRVPRKRLLKREEAISELAKRYFLSRGPATLSDFVWWSGLPVADARNGIDALKTILTKETLDNREYYYSGEHLSGTTDTPKLHLLPAYDEFLIAYRERSDLLSEEEQKKTVSNNGIFRPIIVSGGKVIGIWKRTTQKRKQIITPTFFKTVDGSVRKRIEAAVLEYQTFSNFEIELDL